MDGDCAAPSVQKLLLIKSVENTEDWNGEGQSNQQRNYYPQGPQCSPSYDIPDRFTQQLKLEKEWNEKMEHLNDKYNLDYYSSSESDSKPELEHEYETFDIKM